MKKILSVLFCALMAVQFINANDVVAQDINQLPIEARNFINQHFPNATVSNVKVNDQLFSSKDYEVLFSNGMRIEFDERGMWTEIDTQRERMPVALVPANINTYVQRTYASNYVTKIEHDNDGYKVRLNNGLDVKFDQNGAFKEVDD